MCRLACFRLHVSEWEKNRRHLKDVVSECSLYKSNTKRSTNYPQSLQHTFIIQFCAFECFIIHLYLYIHTRMYYIHMYITQNYGDLYLFTEGSDLNLWSVLCVAGCWDQMNLSRSKLWLQPPLVWKYCQCTSRTTSQRRTDEIQDIHINKNTHKWYIQVCYRRNRIRCRDGLRWWYQINIVHTFIAQWGEHVQLQVKKSFFS